MKKLIILIVSFIVLLSSCDLASPIDVTLVTPDFDMETGLLINVNSDSNFRSVSIDPMILTIDKYTISGNFDDSSETFTFDVSSAGSYLKAGLSPGLWDITVSAYDVLGVEIADASASDIDVKVNETITVPIIVVPVSGTGSLSLNLHWSATDVTTPDFATSPPTLDGMTSGAPLISAIVVVGDVGTALCTDTLNAGYYVFSITLEDSSGTFVKTITTALRILDGQTTEGDVYFNDDPGDISFDISSELHNPFDLTLTKNPDVDDSLSLSNTENMTVTVTPDTGTGATYWWYLNGTEITVSEIQNSISIISSAHPLLGGDYPLGYYTLTAIVSLTDGAMSSDDTSFTIEP